MFEKLNKSDKINACGMGRTSGEIQTREKYVMAGNTDTTD
jgi:hypothetical protein